MPAYITNPSQNTPVPLLQPGIPGYSIGSSGTADASSPVTKFDVSQVSLATNVATVTGTIREGKVPVAGQLISITGTTTASGAFNVSAVAITAVSIDAATGQGTISFALTHADVGATADVGQAYIPPAETGATLTNGTYLQFAVQERSGENQNQRAVTWSTLIAGGPSTVTVTLEASMVDVDAQYNTLDSSTSTTGEERVIANVNFRFYRLKVANVSGGSSPTIIGKILI